MTIETGIPRRAFLIGGSALLLVACAPAGPGAVTLVAQGAAGMNPGPDGADRPLTLQVLQLRGAGAFDGQLALEGMQAEAAWSTPPAAFSAGARSNSSSMTTRARRRKASAPPAAPWSRTRST